MKPLIGLTPSVSDNHKQIVLNRDYAEAVRRCGALPVLLPLAVDDYTLDGLFNRLDGIVFTGGADLEPATYGMEKLPVCGETEPQRDEMEIYLIRRCLLTGLPFLAICRGFEVMNAALGGTLYQDIATQRPGSVKHPCYDTPADKVHAVSFVQGTRLTMIEDMPVTRVNSRHHQGVCEVGKGLTVSAYAEDGLIEGIELPEHPFAVGVQWHPETLSSFTPEAQRLFDALTAAAVRRMA